MNICKLFCSSKFIKLFLFISNVKKFNIKFSINFASKSYRENFKLYFLVNITILFSDQQIDIEALQYIKDSHIAILLKNFPLGIHIKFEHYIEQFQKKCKSDESNLNPGINIINTNQTKSISPRIQADVKYINESFQLEKILLNNVQVWNESCRNLLVEIIINNLIKNHTNMTIKLTNYIADVIVAVFPSEIKDIYFIKDVINKSPKGKLYCKYFNTIRCMSQNGLIPAIEKEPSTSKIKLTCTIDNLQIPLEIETESENVANYLSNHDMTWPEIEEIWRKTINYRLQFMKKHNTAEIFNKWQHYTKPMGYKLVSFCYKYNFKFKILTFIKYIADTVILDERVKDCGSKIIIEKLKNTPNLSNNSKFLIIMYLLHSVLIPTSRKVTRDENGKKSYIKYVIKDSQNSIIKITETASEMEALLKKMTQKEGPIQPCILIVGTLFDPKQILIYFDTVKYMTFTILKAFDVCFKIFHVFNVEYPHESEDIWLFLQKVFYNIHNKYDKSCTLIKQISSELTSTRLGRTTWWSKTLKYSINCTLNGTTNRNCN
ncbi:hypothetical protein AGLY_003471, partial [Aphis glycines]